MSGTSFIHGFHAITARLRLDAKSVHELYCDSARADPRMRELVKLATNLKLRVLQVDARRLDGMAPPGRHQGVVAKVDALRRQVSLDDLLDGIKEAPLLLVLDGVQDPHNLGACLRSAEAAGVHAVVVPKDRAARVTPVVRKTSAGASEVVPLFQVTNLVRTLRALKAAGIWITGTTENAAQTIYQQDLTGPIALVMGGEGQGLRRLTLEHCDFLVRIPMSGVIESLNVSVATGVCLFEIHRQRNPR